MTTYAINAKTITVFIDNTLKTVHAGSPNFEQLKSALRNLASEDQIRKLLSVPEWLKVSTHGDVELISNKTTKEYAVRYKDQIVKGMIAKKLIDLILEGISPGPWVKLMENIEKNPDKVKSRIFEFLEKNAFPITPEGEFIAFKNVRSDYMDIRTGTISNVVGKIVKMPREKVNPDAEVTCSSGLHACASHYLGHYGKADNSRTMIVKINPKNVVSVPIDYENSKIRVCEYEVIGETHEFANAKSEEEKVIVNPTAKCDMTFGSGASKTATTGFKAPADIVEKVKSLGINSYAESIGVKAHLIKNWLLENQPKIFADFVTFVRKTDGKSFSGKEIKEGVKSEGTIAAWARKNGLNASTVGDWLKKIRELEKS